MRFSAMSAAVVAVLLFAIGNANAALVHHYSFDDLVDGGNATDSVGGATGVWDGDAGANIAVPGILGTASQTSDEDGGNGEEHYTIGSLSGIDGAAAFSISLWFNQNVDANNNSTYNGLFMTRFATSVSGGGGENWGLALEDNAPPRHIDWRVDGQSGTEIDDIGGGSGWNHVAMVYDSTVGATGQRTLYYNGTAIVDEAVATAVGAIVTGGSWDIGNDTCCGNREFTGTLDDVAVFNNALSQGDIIELYFGGLGGLDASQAIGSGIPEPTSVALLAAGAVAIAAARRRA